MLVRFVVSGVLEKLDTKQRGNTQTTFKLFQMSLLVTKIFRICQWQVGPSLIHLQIKYIIQCKLKNENTTLLVRYSNLENHCFLISQRK
jgi:hypothetical protein